MTTLTPTAHHSLVQSARRGDDRALQALVTAYRPMIRGMASDRFLPGGDLDDLVQEGMVGLWHAIRDHDEELGPFAPFARLCVDRQMWGAVTRANRQRHRILRDATTFEDWMDVPDHTQDPATINLASESLQRLNAHIGAALSSLEQEVLTRYAAGDSYNEIAEALEVHRKRIDNALQRARRKIEEFRQLDGFALAS